jgi:hypothetical protein
MVNAGRQTGKAPLSDTIINSVARLVDDAQTETRDPSHSDIEFCISRARLQGGDPNKQGRIVGKAKRVRSTLFWAMDNAPENGEIFVAGLISLIRGCGGFRPESPNYVGDDCIKSAADAFRVEGYELALDGELRPMVLDNLSGVALTEALESYVRRACRGVMDAALVVGTGKDLLEATAAHILQELYGGYSERDNFPTLLGQAFVAVGLATPQDKPQAGEALQKRTERAMYELGLAINRLRNKEGTGHGHPWLTSVSDAEARIATELMGVIAERLLLAYKLNT